MLTADQFMIKCLRLVKLVQIASLLAEREGIDNIIFSGGFVRDNK